MNLVQGSANFFCKVPDSKYGFVNHMICYNYLTLLLAWKTSKTLKNEHD